MINFSTKVQIVEAVRKCPLLTLAFLKLIHLVWYFPKFPYKTFEWNNFYNVCKNHFLCNQDYLRIIKLAFCFNLPNLTTPWEIYATYVSIMIPYGVNSECDTYVFKLYTVHSNYLKKYIPIGVDLLMYFV